MSGWYVMHRGWMDGFKPEPFTEREAFLWSIEQAAFQDHDQWFNGHCIKVARGEFATSLREMERAFGWSLKRIRGFMERMGKAQKWAQRRAYEGTQSPTIVNVCNYDVYQTIDEVKGTAKGAVKGTRGAQRGHSEGTQQNKGNNGNKGKEEKKAVDAAAHRGSRLADDFIVPDGWRQWASGPPLNLPHGVIDREADAFADYWRGKAGRDALKLDWQATWRNWARNADKGRGGRRGGGKPMPGGVTPISSPC